MKTIIFAMVVFCAGGYLIARESPQLNDWLATKDPAEKVARISEDLQGNVDERLEAFKSRVMEPQLKQQEKQIAALTAEITSLKEQLQHQQRLNKQSEEKGEPGKQAVVEHIAVSTGPEETNSLEATSVKAPPQSEYMSPEARRQALQQLYQKMALKSVQAGT